MLKSFSDSAKSLSRNPLGIIALNLVFIYGIACLTFTKNQLPEKCVIWFVIFILTYPLVVLAAFFRLVTTHHTKLYAPQDFPRPADFANLANLAYSGQNWRKLEQK